MGVSQAAAQFRDPVRTQRPRGRSWEVVVAMAVAALFGALTAAYFAVNAGADYPEPSTQMP